MLIDSHAHLDNEKLLEKRNEIINSLKENNVKYVINAGCDLISSKNSLNLAKENNQIYCVLGVHPETSNDYNEEFIKFLRKNANNDKVVGVGEIGLDYHNNQLNKEKQADIFSQQVKIANEFNLPIVIHLRDAYGDFLKLIKENNLQFKNGVLFHCFSGSVEFAKELLEMYANVYFSFGGSCTFKNAKNVHEVIKQIPLNKIVSETDCPFLTPEPFRGRFLNEPKYVDLVVQKIADLKQITKSEMEQVIEKNIKNLFKKIK